MPCSPKRTVRLATSFPSRSCWTTSIPPLYTTQLCAGTSGAEHMYDIATEQHVARKTAHEVCTGVHTPGYYLLTSTRAPLSLG